MTEDRFLIATVKSRDMCLGRRAELRLELSAKSSQFPADSPNRRLYLLALIDATKHPQIHGHPTICQYAAAPIE